MNVIGIIQTDMNEFSVLFDQQQGGEQNGGQQGQGSTQGQGQGQQQDQQNDQANDSMFLSFLDEEPSGGQGGGGGNGGGQQQQQQQQQQQNGPQEMTVRIKGIPEGQKANFLQMYQILQDAKDTQSLGQLLTIVDQGDQQQNGQGNNKQSQAQGHGSGKQNRTTH